MMMIGIQATGTRAEMVTQVTILDIAARRRDTLPLDMMMVAFLRQANLCLKAKHLRAIFTHGAVHIVAAFDDFPHPVGKGRNHFWMIVQIARLDEFDIGMCGRHLVGKAVNAVNQNAREQKIGKQHNTLEAQTRHMFETGLNKRKGDPGIPDFGPAKSHAFPQHPRNFGNVGIGIGIRGTAPDHHQAGIAARHCTIGGVCRINGR